MLGPQYPDTVRVVALDDSSSAELCAGTHANNTADLFPFQVVSVKSIGSNVSDLRYTTRLTFSKPCVFSVLLSCLSVFFCRGWLQVRRLEAAASVAAVAMLRKEAANLKEMVKTLGCFDTPSAFQKLGNLMRNAKEAAKMEPVSGGNG